MTNLIRNIKYLFCNFHKNLRYYGGETVENEYKSIIGDS